ncbi:hypothetical protein [Oceanidesulfovibrio marinus]|uniref:hypothetical protein n=1 Tax=Oceanidesulfovibrio marinus TaxID=370038 RepID=UPI00142EC5D5|nr:hypothetical protein [Oceanidesulfovibrio marinus]
MELDNEKRDAGAGRAIVFALYKGRELLLAANTDNRPLLGLIPVQDEPTQALSKAHGLPTKASLRKQDANAKFAKQSVHMPLTKFANFQTTKLRFQSTMDIMLIDPPTTVDCYQHIQL